MKLRPLLALLLSAFICSPSALAHALTTRVAISRSPSSQAFNLGSAKQSFSAGALGNFASQLLHVGQHTLTVTDTSMLTAGEMVALEQLLGGETQTLTLNNSGRAVGGSFQIGTLESQPVSSLYIPRGVTAIDTIASLNFSGSLVNAGKLYVVSTNSQSLQDKISALNIDNLAGGLLTSNVSGLTLPGLSGLTSHLSLSLNAANNIANFGTISSAGDLSLAASGSIANSNSHHGGVALLQAANSINLSSGTGNFTNSGMISALANDINIATTANTDLNFNNAGGNLQALNGAINFRDASFSDDANLNLTGGNLSAQAVNFYSGTGVVAADVGELNGTVNASAGCAHIVAATSSLDLGTMNLSGDPTFYNTAGDVYISSDLVFPGQSLAIIASGDILSAQGAGVIDTNSINSGSILMVAGAHFRVIDSTQSSGTNGSDNFSIHIYGGTTQGGMIDLTQGGGITELSSASVSPPQPYDYGIGADGSITISFPYYSYPSSGNGGNIALVAYGGTNNRAGTVTLPSTVPIASGGIGSGLNGSVTIIAGANSGTAVNIGGIVTTGGAPGSGNIAIVTAQPTISTSSRNCSPCVVIQSNGALDLSGGAFESDSNILPTNVITGGLYASGSKVSITSGGSVQTGTIDVSSSSSSGGQIDINAAGNVVVNGGLFANGASYVGASGGVIGITAGGNLLVNGSVSANGGYYPLTPVPSDIVVTLSNWQQISGPGGKITLSSNSSSAFVIGSASINGVSGTVSATGGNRGSNVYINDGLLSVATASIGGSNVYGDGGSISITNNGTGGITLTNDSNISVAASADGGKGGSLSFYAPNGTLTLAQGTLSVNGSGSTDGPVMGYIVSLCCIYVPRCCNGGNISLVASQIVVSGVDGGQASGTLNLSANGSGGANGGSISISALNGNLKIGNNAGQITIIGTNTVNTYSNQCVDSISLFAGANLTVDMSVVALGYAPSLNFSAGANVTVNMSTDTSLNVSYLNFAAGNSGQGNLLVVGNINADNGSGAGGEVILSSNSSKPFVVGGATVNGITGTISATGSPAPPVSYGGISLSACCQLTPESGGSISITNNGTGGITISNLANLNVSSSGGPGGSITLNAGSGVLRMAQGTLSVDGSEIYNFNYYCCAAEGMTTIGAFINEDYCCPVVPYCCHGGHITLEASRLHVTAVGGGVATGPLNLSANGYGPASAGTITLDIHDGVTIGDQPGQITVSTLSITGPAYPIGCCTRTLAPSNPPNVVISGGHSTGSIAPIIPAPLPNTTVDSSTSEGNTTITSGSFASSIASLFSRVVDTRPSVTSGSNEAKYNGDVFLTEVNSSPNPSPPVTKATDDPVVDTGDSEPE